MNSEWRMPREKAGARRRVTVHLSGLWAPGPGFCVASERERERGERGGERESLANI